MKKLICLVTLILAFLAPQALSYAQSGLPYIPSWSIQHRVYESGLEFYRIQFSVRIDEGNLNTDPYSDADNITRLTLTTPDNEEYVFERDYIGEDYIVNLYKDNTYFVYYDGNTGHFFYNVDGAGQLIKSYEPVWCISALNLDTYSFPPGDYSLLVEFADGTTMDPGPFHRSEIVPIPIIDSKTITAECTPEGIWFRWEAPSEIFEDVDTSTRLAIELSSEGSPLTTHVATAYDLYTRVPFHMGGLFIPTSIAEQLETIAVTYGGDDTVPVVQQTRVNDNSERRYSDVILFSFVDCMTEVQKDNYKHKYQYKYKNKNKYDYKYKYKKKEKK